MKILILLQVLILSICIASPNVTPDFSMTATVIDYIEQRQTTLDLFVHYTLQNFSQINQEFNYYALHTCHPYYHDITYDYFNQVCYPSCLYGVNCQSHTTCGDCTLDDPWKILKKA